MVLNEKSESIVYKAWLKSEQHYFVSIEGDVYSEWNDKNSLITELEEAFGLEWQNEVDIHEIKVTYERIK